MGYCVTSPEPQKTAAREIFCCSIKSRPKNRSQAPELNQANRLTSTKITSGIPYWISRDSIVERGGLNLYGILENDVTNRIDFLGLKIEYANSETRKKIQELLDKVKDEVEGFDECWTSLFKAKPQVYFFNLVDKGGSRVIDFPIKGIKPEGSKRIDIDKTQVDTGYSLESIFVHEIRHACQHQSGCRAGLSDAEAEKEAMDWGNEYRDKAKEKKRSYTDHKRITEEDNRRGC